MDKSYLYLIGMPGCGKSTLGKKLAQKNGSGFCDTDLLICDLAKAAIEEIFDQGGEELFREWEKRALLFASQGEKRIIATGGGIILAAENVDLMRKTGRIVYIYRTLEELSKADLDTKDRPLLREDGALEKLFLQREPLYRQSCDKIIINNNFAKALTDLETYYKSSL